PRRICFLFQCHVAARALHSFPTRRSSDLSVRARRSLPAKRTLVRSLRARRAPSRFGARTLHSRSGTFACGTPRANGDQRGVPQADRKSTRLNSSHVAISYAVFCLKKKTHA